MSLPGRGFLDALGSVIDSADVGWIWLTHPDRDHTGGLFALLDAAPPAPRRMPEFLQTLTAAPAADAFTGPGQAALEQMLAGFEPSPATG